jgi:hypothetical protein
LEINCRKLASGIWIKLVISVSHKQPSKHENHHSGTTRTLEAAVNFVKKFNIFSDFTLHRIVHEHNKALPTLYKNNYLSVYMIQCSSESSGMYCHVLNWMSTDVSIKNMPVHPRKFWASYSPSWELEISHDLMSLHDLNKWVRPTAMCMCTDSKFA